MVAPLTRLKRHLGWQPMLLGYNTNGLAHHDPLDAIDLLADLGYRSVALTLDHAALNPFAEDLPRRIAEVRARLKDRGMRSVIETGARFLLDPRIKHEPTLVSPDPTARAKRIDFYRRAIDVAVELGSDCVSIWSGAVRDGASDFEAFDRLLDGLAKTLDHAAVAGRNVAFEPEPGMFVDTMAKWEALLARFDHPRLKLTLDVGHLHCQGETPVAGHILKWKDRLANVHIEDMRSGVHEHLMFGEGEMDFPPILKALADAGYHGGLHVELSRHSHDGPNAARRAMEFLRPLVDGATG